MKQSLQLKISQSLTMTPQLQQAIKLLQLSSLDLQSEIQELLDSNPLLDSEAGEDSYISSIGSETESNRADATSTSSGQSKENASQSLGVNDSSTQQENSEHNDNLEQTDSSDKLNSDNISDELATDSQWEDWGYVSQGGSGSRNSSDDNNFEYQGETSESLQEQLQWQIDMMNLSEVDHAIATILIDSIDERGYMQADIDDLIAMFDPNQADFEQEHSLPTDTMIKPEQDNDSAVNKEEIEAVLHLLQSFEPAGIAARNLQECLQIQLKRLDQDQLTNRLAMRVIEQTFDLLSSRNYRQIMRELSITEEQLKSAVDLIQTLNPRPGNQLSQNSAQYIIPDVFVSKDSKGVWGVELNNSTTPKLKINDDYAALIKRADNSADNVYLKNNLQDAKWFIKSLQSRNETLLKVASCIVSKQIGFLEYGEEAMKPLVLNDVAEEVEMHESTISRVTTQKFMHTPKGIFELKYFFSSHVGTTAGGECSSTAIRAVIKKLINAENQSKPLSDSKLANLLKDQGIKVARRTVAKYREAMSIPPSNERKQLI
jgi:RNA polymerase sigma-54 factor